MDYMGISIEEFKRIAKRLYMLGDRKPMILLGPPGVGKTEGVRQLAMEIADELNMKFIEYDESVADRIMMERDRYFPFLEFRLYEADPSDFIGIPREEGGYVVYKPLRWAKVFSTGPGLLSLDEITNVQRLDLQAVIYKIFERKVGFIRFHKDVIITATGNRPEDSAIATMLPAPLINRVRVFHIKAPDIGEWVEYMYRTRGHSWDKRVAAFLARFRQFFLEKLDDVETLNQFATPKAWTGLAEFSHKDEDLRELEMLAVSSVGDRAGQHFVMFCKLQVPDVSRIIEEPECWDELDVDKRYMAAVQVSSLILDIINRDGAEEAIRRIGKFMNYLCSRDREFLTLIMMLLPTDCRAKVFTEMLRDRRLRHIAQRFTKLIYKVKKVEG